MKPSPPGKPRRHGIAALVLVLVGAVVGVSLWQSGPSEAPTSGKQDALERAALERFRDSKVSLTYGEKNRVEVTDEAHAREVKINLFKKLLAQQAESQDAGFALDAEQRLEAKRPAHVSIRWNDITGNQELSFVVEDTQDCNLPLGSSMTIRPRDFWRHRCLERPSTKARWLEDPEASLTVQADPVRREESEWTQLLREEKKALAAQAFLESAEASDADAVP